MEGGRKVCLKNQVFSLFLKTPSKGTRHISRGKMFQRWGATTEKARFLDLSFRASLGVKPPQPPSQARSSDTSRTRWEQALCQVRYWGPKPFRALYVSINTLKSMQKLMGNQCKAARVGEIWYFFTPVNSLEDVFWTICSFRINVKGSPMQTALQ